MVENQRAIAHRRRAVAGADAQAEDRGEEIGQGREAGIRGHGRLIWKSKGAHLTRICPLPVGLHDFDMQSSGGLAGAFSVVRINGFLMSFLGALRSLAEQVAMSVRLIIGGVSTLVDKSR